MTVRHLPFALIFVASACAGEPRSREKIHTPTHIGLLSHVSSSTGLFLLQADLSILESGSTQSTLSWVAIALSLSLMPVVIGVLLVACMNGIGDAARSSPMDVDEASLAKSQARISGDSQQDGNVALFVNAVGTPASLGPSSRSLPSTPQPVLASAGDGKTLSNAFIVQQLEGITLTVHGLFTQCPQEDIIDISRNDALPRVVLRAFISEMEKDGGVLLETPPPGRIGIAFVDTAMATNSPGALPRGRRKVFISSATPVLRYPYATPFAVVETSRVQANTFELRRGTGGCKPGEPLMLIRSDGAGLAMSLLSVHGHLLASVAPAVRHRPVGNRADLLFHVKTGVDASLALCAFIAARKLR